MNGNLSSRLCFLASDIKFDDWGVPIADENYFKHLAQELINHNTAVTVYNLGNATRFDVLFSLPKTLISVEQLQGGIRSYDLFVSIMRKGAFAFSLGDAPHDPEDIMRGLFLMRGDAEPMAKLINNVISAIKEIKS